MTTTQTAHLNAGACSLMALREVLGNVITDIKDPEAHSETLKLIEELHSNLLDMDTPYQYNLRNTHGGWTSYRNSHSPVLAHALGQLADDLNSPTIAEGILAAEPLEGSVVDENTGTRWVLRLEQAGQSDQTSQP